MTMREDDKPAPDLPSVAERRCVERYPCSLSATWRVLDSESDRSGEAEVCDISTKGIGLILGSAVRAGEVLAVQLHCRNQQLARRMPVRVMYALEREFGEWRVGGCFIRPLTQLELRAALDES
jgi:hypothetical protein